jgi:hypothetical protein
MGRPDEVFLASVDLSFYLTLILENFFMQKSERAVG